MVLSRNTLFFTNIKTIMMMIAYSYLFLFCDVLSISQYWTNTCICYAHILEKIEVNPTFIECLIVS